jgi:hypothetical protein
MDTSTTMLTNAYIHTRKHTHILHASMHVCTHTSMQTYTHAHTHTCMCINSIDYPKFIIEFTHSNRQSHVWNLPVVATRLHSSSYLHAHFNRSLYRTDYAIEYNAEHIVTLPIVKWRTIGLMNRF